MAKVLVELNGADPVHIASEDAALEVIVVDWDEVRAGAYSEAELWALAAAVVTLSPTTAYDLVAEAQKLRAAV